MELQIFWDEKYFLRAKHEIRVEWSSTSNINIHLVNFSNKIRLLEGYSRT